MGAIKNKKGVCPECNNEEEKTLIGGKCNYHYWKHRKEINAAKRGTERKVRNNKPIKHRSTKGQKVATEDVKFFHEIWNERNKHSEISGEFLGNDYNPVFMSHILTKGAYPKFRHLKENILLMTHNEHDSWEFRDRTTPMFKKKFKRALYIQDKLKKKYYEKTT